MNLGAFDFLTKPIEIADLEITIQKTWEEAELLKEAARSRELAEKNKLLEELDLLKSKFFTNISHEFRTPLTVIAGMAQQIRENPERWLGRGLSMILRNTNDLLDLVRQILDLRKLDAGKLRLQMVRGDVIPFFHYILESFYPLAEARDIRLTEQFELSELEMDYDPEKLQRIVSNLLGNAIKFCREGDEVCFEAVSTGDHLQVRVRDTGPGISPKQLPHIFVRELALLMGGNIEVQSDPGQGSTFTISLPIRRETPLQPAQAYSAAGLTVEAAVRDSPGVSSAENVLTELPTLLIVEDNADVAEYLTSCLEGLYEINWEKDGQAGIEKALETVPDIIISDVMMPRKDGFELCQSLKTDTRTSHIPIVLLTAKADAESRLTGLQRGADAYLSKPFDRRELLVRLEQLLELRNRLRERYRSLEDLPAAEEEAVRQEDQFVVRVKEAIHAHMDEETFGIVELCRTIGASRSQLHRKIKALTGRSTSSFIRYIRLLHGKKLLADSSLNISQIAYDCGFRDPGYFSTTFNREFGIGPKDFRKEVAN
jgi:YesN/AraC family two-component response regulator